MTEKERYWLAGILEGEACFTPSRVKRRNGVIFRNHRIQVSMADEDIIRRIHQIVGAGFIWHGSQSRSIHHALMWKFGVTGWIARLLMETIYDLMGERRKAQIDAAIDEVEV